MSQAGSRQAWQLDCGSKDDPALVTLVITKPLAEYYYTITTTTITTSSSF